MSVLVPSEASAQRRGGSRGRSSPAVVTRPSRAYAPSRVYYPSRFYYSPRFYSPFYYYDPFFWGAWGGGYGYGYGGYDQYPYPYYRGGYYDQTGAARLQVSPKQTQVFVDGYYVGVADEFDGALQRLRVEAGEHELQLYLDGYRTVTTPILFRREGTITIKQVMQPLAAGETSERPTPQAPPAGERDDANAPEPADPRVRPGDRRPPPQARTGRDDYGTLAIRVQPGDAEILIDGQRWDGSDNGSRLSVQLADGPHRIEVRREGYRPYTANVRIRRGQTESLNISLTQ
ncbi:MAG: PEGA domain-containing protein [Vicinamibacterales bacterium]